MIPFRTGHRISFEKELASRARQHDTDIDRLWRLQQQLSEGEYIGGDPAGPFPIPPTTGGGSVTIYEGELTATCIAPTNGKTGATLCAAVEWIVDPLSVSSPIGLINDVTPKTLVNRDTTLTGEVGDYVQWYEKTLSDGSVENRIIWIMCP